MRLLLIAAAVSALAAPAAAQSWNGYNTGRGHERSSGWDVQSQYDRPGDYRCDAFWDANRTDCGARWRDQRSRTSWNAGYTNRAYGHGYSTRQRGYGHAGRGYGSGAGTAYYGAYGRPDVVYPSGGYGGGYAAGGGRDPHRIDWCRASYRSYDPSSGYYRAYSGRLVWCG
ncbi:MAG: BA14K family protein [Pseudomonadota bacterium]